MTGSQKKYAVVGATGAVGHAMMQILAERQFPASHLFLIASERSAGKQLPYNGTTITVQAVADFDFSSVDVAFFSAGAAVSKVYALQAEASGCLVIDNTSCFRYEDDIPLIIPEVNPEAIKKSHMRKIIANPNCATIGVLVAIKPLYDAVGITRINVATYQSVSGAGQGGIGRLNEQTKAVLQNQPLDSLLREYPKPIAFNALPHIDQFQDNGFTREEMKMVWETQKILSADIEVNPTCVRVPVLIGHSAAVQLETKVPISVVEARALLQAAPGVKVVDDHSDGGYPTAVTEGTGTDLVYVGRIRNSLFSQPGLNLWVVADNLRKGAALNSIQIAEMVADELPHQASSKAKTQRAVN